MSVARLLASDFPSENPRAQTRHFLYTKRYALFKLNEENPRKTRKLARL
jgi:hypothetical protein